MERSSQQRTKIIGALSIAALVAILSAVLLLRADGSAAISSKEVNPSFSVLEPASENAKASLSAQARTWLAETDRGGLGGVAAEPLTGFASSQTAVGPVVLAQFGQFICAYSDSFAMGGCGTMSLINEGKLLSYIPGCPTTRVFGVLPDGFEEVQAAAGLDAGKASRSIPVIGNVYSADLPTKDTVLRAEGSRGQSFELALPLGTQQRRCSA